jgi:hypothetical protein
MLVSTAPEAFLFIFSIQEFIFVSKLSSQSLFIALVSRVERVSFCLINSFESSSIFSNFSFIFVIS